jgi:hypothetical protein
MIVKILKTARFHQVVSTVSLHNRALAKLAVHVAKLRLRGAMPADKLRCKLVFYVLPRGSENLSTAPADSSTLVTTTDADISTEDADVSTTHADVQITATTSTVDEATTTEIYEGPSNTIAWEDEIWSSTSSIAQPDPSSGERRVCPNAGIAAAAAFGAINFIALG